MTVCICFAFAACDFDESNDNFYGGEILDEELLESIRDALMNSETSSSDTAQTTETADETYSDSTDETDVDNAGDETDITVFWIENGSVWHLYEDCGHVDGRECTSGSIAEAKKAGKERVCHTCEKKAEQETYEATTAESLVTESDTTEITVTEAILTEPETIETVVTETTVTEAVTTETTAIETATTEPEMTESATTESETTEPETTEPETTEADDGTVYWIENGSVWHNDVNCQHIKGKDIISGSVEDAMEAGKERLCKSCEK